MNSGKPMACVGYGVGYEVSASYNPLISHDKHGIYLRANSTKAWTRQAQHSQTGAAPVGQARPARRRQPGTDQEGRGGADWDPYTFDDIVSIGLQHGAKKIKGVY